MKRFALLAIVVAFALPLQSASAQSLNARRMAMGGVVLPGGGGEGFNAAYRAVPIPPRASIELPLPLGLVPLIANPPVLDPDDPDFNLYELANHLYRPPWNLALVAPEPASDDIAIELGRDHLAIEIGEIKDVFPTDRSTLGVIGRAPTLGFGLGPFYAGATAVVHYQNDLRMNAPLYEALAGGAPFRPNTGYALYDNALGQAAAGLELGWAAPVFQSGDTRTRRGTSLVGGVRTRVLRGLAYGSAENVVTFNTLDTLFASSPVRVDYDGFLRRADPAHGGWGHALDLGAVYVQDAVEIGLGMNDVVSRIDWKVEESVAWRDSLGSDFARAIIADDVPFSSELPRTTTLNVAWRARGLLLAADAVRSMGHVTGHLGGEAWLGPVALRAGAAIDEYERVQLGAGVGVRVGRVGVDVGLATNNRNVSRERGLELGAGLALYR
jgi:hypothetical protein